MLGHRVMLTAAIVVILLILLACVGYFSGGWEDDPAPLKQRFGLASAESRPEVCVADEETREMLRTIMIGALDEALHDQFKSLFLTWLKDERGQPDRARVGVRQSIIAHQQGKKFALEWTPPICSN